MDQIIESFINKIKGTFTSSALQTSGMHFETWSSSKPVIQPFNEMGWGLPVRERTRFTDNWRKLLYDIFIQEEESWKKDFPTGSSLTNKEKFKEEYVTSQQIKSLFSRWSQLKQKGKLIDAENSEEPEDDSYLSYQGKSF